ncbi:LPS export ABC transporter ATP-binding protein [bacterium]|nr:LPS export ABC transporter ATP-binding protein [bacterium]
MRIKLGKTDFENQNVNANRDEPTSHLSSHTVELSADYIDHQREAKKTLRAEALVKKYGGRSVVNGVDVQVTQGEIVGLLGPNGAGKTTTFYMITGMIKPNVGRIFLDEKNITKMAMYRRARMGIGYLSQEASIFRKLTVEQNIMAILQTLDISRQERKQRLEQLLEDMTITRIAKNKGYSLSGGERRRTEIARALVTNPRFLLLDEPFAGIDPIAVEDIQSIVKELRERGIGILITDHNVHETLAITNRAYLLFDGKVLKSGSAEYLADDPEARKLYLGDKFKLRH